MEDFLLCSIVDGKRRQSEGEEEPNPKKAMFSYIDIPVLSFEEATTTEEEEECDSSECVCVSSEEDSEDDEGREENDNGGNTLECDCDCGSRRSLIRKKSKPIDIPVVVKKEQSQEPRVLFPKPEHNPIPFQFPDRKSEFNDYDERLNSLAGSYRTWPYPYEELATCGFYYAGWGDCLRCFCCGMGLKNWDSEDVAAFEHLRWQPRCAYMHSVLGSTNIKLFMEMYERGEYPLKNWPKGSLLQIRDGSLLRYLESYMLGRTLSYCSRSSSPTARPGVKYGMTNYFKRLATFTGIGPKLLHKELAHKELAASGFFRNAGGSVECFACTMKGPLFTDTDEEYDYRETPSDISPMLSHIRAHPDCPFVKYELSNDDLLKSICLTAREDLPRFPIVKYEDVMTNLMRWKRALYLIDHACKHPKLVIHRPRDMLDNKKKDEEVGVDEPDTPPHLQKLKKQNALLLELKESLKAKLKEMLEIQEDEEDQADAPGQPLPPPPLPPKSCKKKEEDPYLTMLPPPVLPKSPSDPPRPVPDELKEDQVFRNQQNLHEIILLMSTNLNMVPEFFKVFVVRLLGWDKLSCNEVYKQRPQLSEDFFKNPIVVNLTKLRSALRMGNFTEFKAIKTTISTLINAEKDKLYQELTIAAEKTVTRTHVLNCMEQVL